MKHKKSSQSQNEKPASAVQPTAAVDLNPSGIDFVPAPEEVARRAYFSYVNQGSMPGHDVQHWLEAEAQLLAERNLTRVHAFYKQHEANHASAHAGSVRLPA
jgi:hypothetical protein